LDKFDLMRASLAIEDFWLNDLSLWYVRRSRKRFQQEVAEQPPNRKLPSNFLGQDKEEAEQILYYTLLILAKLIAPMMPFLAEEIYQKLKAEKGPESVHLCKYPEVDEEIIDEELEKEMQEVRDVVSLVLAKRAEVGIGVRQALQKFKVKNSKLKIKEEFLELIKDEVNIKEVVFDDKIKDEVELDTEISEKLKEEGQVREIIRQIQDLRKKAGLVPADRVIIYYAGDSRIISTFTKNEKQILATTKSQTAQQSNDRQGDFLAQKEVEVDAKPLWLGIEKP